MSVNLEEIKKDCISQINQYVEMKALEKSNADLLIKLISNAENPNEVISIFQLGSTYKRTGLHYDKRLEKFQGNTIKFFKKNEALSFSDGTALPHNKLIVGENYDALLNLLIEYRGKIDVIYIDPPYGKDKMGEFAKTNYDNAITRDNLLSMLHPRLLLAKQLLSPEGVIFVSIDDKNQAYIKCLMDDVFGETNFVSCCFVLDDLKGKTNDNFFSSVGSKLLVFAKNKKISNELGFNEVENIYGDKIEKKFKDEDKLGLYSKITFLKTGQSKFREDRPYMFYPILQKNGVLYEITEEEFNKLYNKNTKKFNDNYLNELRVKYKDYEFILPKDSNGNYLRWTCGYKTFSMKKNDEIFYDNGVKQKIRPTANELLHYYEFGRPKTFMYKPSYSLGTENLKDVLGENKLDFAKPVYLIDDIIKLNPNKNAIVLDFFAGSGTTGQAVLQANREDEGTRQFILCTSNEITDKTPNGVVLDVTSKRLKRVMTGSCYDGSTNFKWLEKNKPFGGSLDVFEIGKVANFAREKGKTPFDLIDETLYGKDKFSRAQDKIKWVCENFEITQELLKEKGESNVTRS